LGFFNEVYNVYAGMTCDASAAKEGEGGDAGDVGDVPRVEEEEAGICHG
jgi:hypothetical protein